MTMFAKTGPRLNSKRRLAWSNTDTPVTSLGSRSGVNWMRLTVQSTDRASALASMVLPTPGTSSMSRCPSASSTVRRCRDRLALAGDDGLDVLHDARGARAHLVDAHHEASAAASPAPPRVTAALAHVVIAAWR